MADRAPNQEVVAGAGPSGQSPLAAIFAFLTATAASRAHCPRCRPATRMGEFPPRWLGDKGGVTAGSTYRPGGMLGLMSPTFTTSDGVRIAYQEVGVGDPPIVFIHGIYGTHQAFGNQVEYFSPNHRCIAVDLRGHGESDKPDQVYSMARYADDVAELMRHLELPPAVMVGHSMGGQVVISVAARHPDLVRAVASLDSPSNIPGWQKRFHSPFDHLITFDGPYREGVRRFLAAAYLPTDDPSWVGGLEERLAGIPDHMIVRAWDAMKAYEPSDTLRRMTCPYLYVDSGQPDLDFDLLREHCPQVVVGKTVGAGHKALQDVPDQINAMLNRFIQHAEGIAAEMVRTGGVFRYNFPDL